MRRHFGIILMAASLISAASCTKEATEEAYAKQESLISSFVEKKLESNHDLKVTYNGGSVRITLNEGEGMEVNARGKVSITYAGYDFKKGTMDKNTLFATNSRSVAASSGWELSDESSFEPLVIDLSDKEIIPGLRNGLVGVSEGEECIILFTGKYGFGKKSIGTISANAPLAYQIWVEHIDN